MATASTTCTECRAIGVVPNSSLTPLANTLRGLCTKYSDTHVYEAVLSIPGKNTRIKMLRKLHRKDTSAAAKNPFQEKLPDRWLMVYESDPNRGPAYRELPAAVREVCESHCFCNHAPSFWQSLGARLEYDMVKDGREYVCFHESLEIKVQLVRMLALQQPGNPDSATVTAPAAGQAFVIDVSTRVPEGRHAEGARAVGSLAQVLQPLVTLQRADVNPN